MKHGELSRQKEVFYESLITNQTSPHDLSWGVDYISLAGKGIASRGIGGGGGGTQNDPYIPCLNENFPITLGEILTNISSCSDLYNKWQVSATFTFFGLGV